MHPSLGGSRLQKLLPGISFFTANTFLCVTAHLGWFLVTPRGASSCEFGHSSCCPCMPGGHPERCQGLLGITLEMTPLPTLTPRAMALLTATELLRPQAFAGLQPVPRIWAQLYSQARHQKGLQLRFYVLMNG